MIISNRKKPFWFPWFIQTNFTTHNHDNVSFVGCKPKQWHVVLSGWTHSSTYVSKVSANTKFTCDMPTCSTYIKTNPTVRGGPDAGSMFSQHLRISNSNLCYETIITVLININHSVVVYGHNYGPLAAKASEVSLE